MSYNNVLPAWVYAIPENVSDMRMLIYLVNEAEKDGMPEHVRLRRIEELNKKMEGIT
jgi:hypothetical protein